MLDKNNLSKIIKSEAISIGFLSCGISKAEFLSEEAPKLESWLKSGFNGEMSYMERNFDKRLDPRLLVPGCKSIVSLLFNYYTEKKAKNDHEPKISSYAYGKDYHFVIKAKLRELLSRIKNLVGDINGRVFVDSAPVMDKAWAKKSGLGWIGKNTNLINKKTGSFFFIAELILDLELEYDHPTTDHCGSCTACIDSCPTNALATPYKIDATKCISYATIELKNNIPNSFKDNMKGWIFGCDICQDVCPWNRFSKNHNEPSFEDKKNISNMSKKQWEDLTKEVFDKVFKESPIKRTGYSGIKRNINFAFSDK
ncbi:MAG: tRNA epoxyqueuosine(34) reductase QueG [Bacteroidota bacterium]|nr:tRNA epoxyqueuosine(34) reductase QueG [Bacteroidota bacterium]